MMESGFAYAERKKTMPAIFTIALALSLFFAGGRAADQPKKTLVFLGDSLTAGLGVQPTEAFPAIVAEKIRSGRLAVRSRRTPA